MTIGLCYLAIGWAFFVLWAATEYHVCYAQRRAGQFPRLRWYHYAIAPVVILVVWPWMAAMIMRQATLRARQP